MRWLKDALEKRFAFKTQCIGPGAVIANCGMGADTSTGPAVTTVNGEEMKQGSEGILLNRVLGAPPRGGMWKQIRGMQI